MAYQRTQLLWVCQRMHFAAPSVLYGCSGEQWDARSRLLDFSYAGYRAGEAPLPDMPPSVDLKASFGARGDGRTDDTQAFLDAIEAVTDQGVIYIPPGTYVISQKLDIPKRVVFKGAGRDNTTLLFTKSLTDLEGNRWAGGNSQYTYGPALMNFWGTGRTDASSLLGTVVRNASRGDKRLFVSSTARFSMNAWVRLLLDNVNNGLVADLHSGLIPADTAFNNRNDAIMFNFKVTEIGANFIGFDRPLAVNVSTAWRPEVHSWASYTRTECGVEKLTIRMPWSSYAGMNREQGWNALNFWWTPHSWVNDVSIINSDLGIIVDGSPFFTVQQLHMGVSAPRGSNGYDGTWGVWLKNGADVLVTRFNMSRTFTQDFGAQSFQLGTVISNGVGVNLSVNALYAGPYATLVSNVNFGAARNPYGLSGAGPKASSYSTFWNVRADVPFPMPRTMYGPRMTWIGANLARWTGINATLQWYLENNSSAPTWPVDLQADQLAQRLAPQQIATAFGPGYGCDPSTSTICCIGFSNLWGCAGELYNMVNSTGSRRLLDWSYAGYMAGEAPIPKLPVVTSVLDFGAVGDGVADDSQAFQDAVDAIGREGTILVPEGQYIITKQISIPNRVVIKGIHPATTRLVFPKPLSEVLGNTSSYTFGPGFIQFNGASWLDGRTFLANVTRDALRGESVLFVGNSSAFSPGQWVRLVLSAPAAGGIATDLMAGLAQETADYRSKPNLLSFNSRVSFVGTGFIKLDRQLPYNVSTRWAPGLHIFDLSFSRQQAGIQDLTIEFPLTPYRGMGREAGFNAIYFWSVMHCWVKNVAIINADMAVTLDGTHFCTVDGLQLSSGSRGVNNGLWGVWLKNGADNLIRNFNAGSRLVRDIAVQGLQPGTVISNSSGVDLSIDAMASGPYGMLLSNVDVGYGSRFWGPQVLTTTDVASFMTAWNVKSQVKMVAPNPLYGPLMNLVAINISDPAPAPGFNWYNENATTEVFPLDLYASQRFERLGVTPEVDPSEGQLAYQGPGYGCNGWTRCLVDASNATFPACAANFTPPSIHFGCAGELWNASQRLPADWSFAGYASGDSPLPDVPVVANVRDYGAVGDNRTDDTGRERCAVHPSGVYRITKTLDMRKSVVLRGAGKNLTTIYIPVSLTDVYGNSWSEAGTGSGVSDYSHGTGFINWWGWDPVAFDRTHLANVTAPAQRGATVLQVSSTAGMSVGGWVRINLDDPGDGSLVRDMNGGLMGNGPNQAGARSIIRHLSRVSAMGPNWIRLERPMIANISLSYNPTVHRFLPSTTMAGIEYLTIEFPLTTYPGHLMEMGYNAVHFNQLAHSWVRDVRIHNSDSGFYSWGMVFCTISGLEITSGDRGYSNGHRGIWLERGQDNLLTGFQVNTRMYHDLSVSFYEHSTAFVNGTGKDINMDHHRAAPYAVLWSNIDLGIGSRAFDSSGNEFQNGNHTSSFITFWNVRGKLNALLPNAGFGPQLNFIGLKTQDWVWGPVSDLGWVLEKPPTAVSPQDLYTAQKLTRATRLVQPPAVVRPMGMCATPTSSSSGGGGSQTPATGRRSYAL
ncbi:hypothetical protein COO60DRAFT_1676006 [Scenedesmus sp. NREL 46B-D3]|nr:hypothetical protein COO60DRAFT_1676006 [Scenedesmus sp. NREL 46B-D3]